MTVEYEGAEYSLQDVIAERRAAYRSQSVFQTCETVAFTEPHDGADISPCDKKTAPVVVLTPQEEGVLQTPIMGEILV